MIIPSRRQKDLTEPDVEAIIIGGQIDFTRIGTLIPRGVCNTWTSGPTDRIRFGYKFEWRNTDGDNTKWEVHGHAPDPAAPTGSNASNGWIIRIKHGNRWLIQGMTAPPTGAPSHWTRNIANADQTHIPTTSDTLARGRRNSI